MLPYLPSALQPFPYNATILYNNNVPKIIIYIFQIIASGGNDLLLPVRKLSLAIVYQTKHKGNSPLSSRLPDRGF